MVDLSRNRVAYLLQLPAFSTTNIAIIEKCEIVSEEVQFMTTLYAESRVDGFTDVMLYMKIILWGANNNYQMKLNKSHIRGSDLIKCSLKKCNN